MFFKQCVIFPARHPLSHCPEKRIGLMLLIRRARRRLIIKAMIFFSVASNSNATVSTSFYRLKFNSTVDVILQNANTLSCGDSETHPWHLNGHDFWVLAFGDGQFNMSSDVNKYNLNYPIMKNTVPLRPYGWTALRFRADNPGIWLFHCHIEAHFLMGTIRAGKI